MTGAVLGINAFSLHADVQPIHGGCVSNEAVGNAQIVGNIDAPAGIRPFEAYVAMRFGPGDGSLIKVGLIDLNSEFDVQGAGAFLINTSHGIGLDFSQSGINGPSIFPTTVRQ